jgi:hypothetical protein
MKKLTLITIASLCAVAAVVWSVPASASPTGVYESHDKMPGFSREASTYTRAPEVDPAQALGALTLLSGTVAIIRGYRRKKK